MLYTTDYETDLIGRLRLGSDGEALVFCRFEMDPFESARADGELETRDALPVFDWAREWLDRYFAGGRPTPDELPLAPRGTEFQQRVWRALEQIPYGQTVTYGQIAARIAGETGKNMSAQAVGGAVGRNPISIIIPCHRVVGAGGNLTGFGGGLATKVKLLEHEQMDMSTFRMPKKVAAWDASC